MLFLVDLDGTLTNTEDGSFKEMKDGKAPVDLGRVVPKAGAVEFIQSLIKRGDQVVVVSDSHPRYVEPVVQEYFSPAVAISLCDKPNVDKVKKGLERLRLVVSREGTLLMGDTWLDVHLGRGLGVPTILIEHNSSTVTDLRDGIGDQRKNRNAGPTFTARDFTEVASIVKNPHGHLLAIEAAFNGSESSVARRPFPDNKERTSGRYIRALARQAQGESDAYDTTPYYREFERVDRSTETLDMIARGIEFYLSKALEYSQIEWSAITCIPDKATTVPPDKMTAILKLVHRRMATRGLELIEPFSWKEGVDGTIRGQRKRPLRLDFLRGYLHLAESKGLRNKSIVVLDDQITTGATAEVALDLLKAEGVKNIMFVALYQLIDLVDSDRPCPNCGKPLTLKIRKEDGVRFYSCVSPRYGGAGCGTTVDIAP